MTLWVQLPPKAILPLPKRFLRCAAREDSQYLCDLCGESVIGVCTNKHSITAVRAWLVRTGAMKSSDTRR